MRKDIPLLFVRVGSRIGSISGKVHCEFPGLNLLMNLDFCSVGFNHDVSVTVAVDGEMPSAGQAEASQHSLRVSRKQDDARLKKLQCSAGDSIRRQTMVGKDEDIHVFHQRTIGFTDFIAHVITR